ncbi:hypothetical protein ACCC92_19495 [Mucilaginibacter sp. Mucisp84]
MKKNHDLVLFTASQTNHRRSKLAEHRPAESTKYLNATVLTSPAAN